MAVVVLKYIDASQTDIGLIPPLTYSSNGGVVQIESEKIAFSSCSDSELHGCTRGFMGTTAATHAAGKVVTLLDVGKATVELDAPQTLTDQYSGGAHSHQSFSADLNLDSDMGSGDGSNPKYIAASMWNILGDTLTRAANYLAGVIGAYSITGAKASTYPAGAVLGQISDGVTDADGAFVAFVDGDGDVTKATAAFKAMSNNSTAGSGFNYGLDLHGPAHDGFNALAILKADVRMSNEVCILNGSGAPNDGTSGTGAGFAGPGSLYIRTSTIKLYINTNTKASPTWTVVGTQS